MKRNIFIALLTVIILSCGCSSETEELPSAEAEQIPQQTEEPISVTPKSHISNTETEETKEDPEDISDNIWSIKTTEESQDYTSEDGTVVLIYEGMEFTITNSFYPEAGEKVQSFFLDRGNDDRVAFAKEAYQFWLEDGEAPEDFIPYYYGTGYEIRQINGYLSVIAHYEEYEGGAHGMSVQYGYVFDEQGNYLALGDVFADVEATREYVIERLKEQAEELAASGVNLFDKEMYEPFIGDLFSEDYPTWYLSENGIEIIANPYSIAPYVTGMLAFTIPYSEDMEWKLARPLS